MAELTPFSRLFMRLSEIHEVNEEGVCVKCLEPQPCDTMRSLWIYDLEVRSPLRKGVPRPEGGDS